MLSENEHENTIKFKEDRMTTAYSNYKGSLSNVEYDEDRENTATW